MTGPTVATVKRLFAVSGNRCAFPHCTNSLIDPASGKVTGRICHIKARRPGGPRYDPNQTQDERHAFENLILMCPIHSDVVDSNPESYTVERLQEIKARHEAENVGGLEPSDDIARQLLTNIESDIAVILNVGAAGGKINWVGDVLRDSAKIVMKSPDILESQQVSSIANVERLIRDIQSAMYDDDSHLPYALALCLDLCDQVGLSEKYGEWIRRELNGYRDYKEFQAEFDDEEQFDAWMKRWAPHRLITPYVLNYSLEGMQPRIQQLPITPMFMAFPVAEVARGIKSARDSNRQEFSVPLLSLGQEHFARLQSVVAEVSPGSIVPPDVQVFYTVSDLEQILNGVRSTVLSLLRDARFQAAS